METSRKYEFNWGLLGDIELGRPNLGAQTRLEVYRLMQFCFRDILEHKYGTEAADQVFYEAGYLAGQHFYRNLIGPQTDLHVFVKKAQELLKELNIGINRIEEADIDTAFKVKEVDCWCTGDRTCRFTATLVT